MIHLDLVDPPADNESGQVGFLYPNHAVGTEAITLSRSVAREMNDFRRMHAREYVPWLDCIVKPVVLP